MKTKPKNKISITVSAAIKAPVEKVWEYWTSPEHIIRWNQASVDWHTPRAENDLRPGGRFTSRMEARDGSAGFDFTGVHDKVAEHALIASTMGDGRTLEVRFERRGPETFVAETFEAEGENTIELQRAGWQAILDNFRKYCEQ